MRTDDELYGLMLGAALGAIFAWLITWISVDEYWERDCIKRGFAEYNSTNGNWQWKERVTNVVTVFHDVWQTNHVFSITNVMQPDDGSFYFWGNTITTTNSDLDGTLVIRSNTFWRLEEK